MTRTETLEEVEFMLSCGLSPQEIVARLGKTSTAVEKALRDCRRLDLARMFDRLRDRSHLCACGGVVKSHQHSRCIPCGRAARGAA